MNKITHSIRNQILSQSLFLVVFLGVLFAFLYILGAFSSRAPRGHEVTYFVDGSAATAVVTFIQDDGGHTLDVQVPWTKMVKFTRPATVILTAGNPSPTGSIQCTLFLDGKEWKKQNAAPPQDKVACAGIVP